MCVLLWCLWLQNGSIRTYDSFAMVTREVNDGRVSTHTTPRLTCTWLLSHVVMVEAQTRHRTRPPRPHLGVMLGVQVNGGESFRFSVNEGEQLGNRVRHTGPPPCRHEITRAWFTNRLSCIFTQANVQLQLDHLN